MLKENPPAKIVLEMHGHTYSVDGLPWDADADELINAFKRLLVSATFPATILNDEYGHYEWVENKPEDVVEY